MPIVTVADMLKDARERATTVRENMLLDAIEPIYEQHKLIEQLRAPEGANITLICDNPDFNGQPNCAVEIVDDWTSWKTMRFTGDTVLECLRAIVAARDALAKRLD